MSDIENVKELVRDLRKRGLTKKQIENHIEKDIVDEVFLE